MRAANSCKPSLQIHPYFFATIKLQRDLDPPLRHVRYVIPCTQENAPRRFEFLHLTWRMFTDLNVAIAKPAQNRQTNDPAPKRPTVPNMTDMPDKLPDSDVIIKNPSIYSDRTVPGNVDPAVSDGRAGWCLPQFQRMRRCTCFVMFLKGVPGRYIAESKMPKMGDILISNSGHFALSYLIKVKLQSVLSQCPSALINAFRQQRLSHQAAYNARPTIKCW
ncbi:hypothetical protein CEK26_000196 [Fusarium fujikuroi]|nr:hypothetical protein CEK26_000196 [Fusarium fujikuroi]